MTARDTESSRTDPKRCDSRLGDDQSRGFAATEPIDMHNESDIYATKIHICACCFYLRPEEMASRIRRAFGQWREISLDVYSTNPSHAHDRVKANSRMVLSRARFHHFPNELNDFTGHMRACTKFVDDTASTENSDVYLFLNDTLFTKHPAWILLRSLKKLFPAIVTSELPILCGKADPYLTFLQTSPFSPGLDRYISTFLFATNRSGVQLLNALFRSNQTKAMIESAGEFREDVIPGKFVALLKLHVLADNSAFSWKGRRGTVEMKRKAGSVLLEHLISARFFDAGVILPVNYTGARDLVLRLATFSIKRWRAIMRFR